MSPKAKAKGDTSRQELAHDGGCCGAWVKITAAQRAQWPWQALHQWAHSRVPFSPARFAEIAGVSQKVADDMIKTATYLKWIEYAGVRSLRVGALARRR